MSEHHKNSLKVTRILHQIINQVFIQFDLQVGLEYLMIRDKLLHNKELWQISHNYQLILQKVFLLAMKLILIINLLFLAKYLNINHRFNNNKINFR